MQAARINSNANSPRYVYTFAYTIRIQNQGCYTVQLMSRHWYVYSGGQLYAEVEGDGVVGQQPILGPLEAFEYTSGTVIEDPVGSMRGTYQLTDQNGREFEIEIPEFDLVYPGAIN